MRLRPVKPKADYPSPPASKTVMATKIQGRLDKNLAKLAKLGILLSPNIKAEDERFPIFRLVLERIQLQNCLSAQDAVARINLNLAPTLAGVEAQPGQKLPKEYVLKELPEPTPGYQHLLEVKLLPRDGVRKK